MDDAARIVVETVRGATTSVGEVMFVLFDGRVFAAFAAQLT